MIMNTITHFPTGAEAHKRVLGRKRTGYIYQSLFILATAIAILFLAILLISIIDSVFGFAVMQDTDSTVDTARGEEYSE